MATQKLTTCLLVLMTSCVVMSLDINGTNVCQRTVTDTKSRLKYIQKPYERCTQTWCPNILELFRCTRCYTLYKSELVFKDTDSERTELYCCAGYQDVNGRCLPDCPKGCSNGACVFPNLCFCHPGWSGESCSSHCGNETWGLNCQYTCNCNGHGQCEPITGVCQCMAGWTGEKCQTPCSRGTYGVRCQQLCQCKNGAECDTANGMCTCRPGYRGALCETRCRQNENCQTSCKCQNNGRCDVREGNCVCPHGWTGEYCTEPCPSGYSGTNCSEICLCYNGGHCNRFSGNCSCTPGFTGQKCEIECKPGIFGSGCKSKCECQHGGTCEHVTGTCACPPGYQGDKCEKRACPDGLYGEQCDQTCNCTSERTKSDCHPITGACICSPGWNGHTCDEPCPAPTYGESCSESCDCLNGGLCHHVTGKCQCAPGYVGKRCENDCPDGYYGFGCTQPCLCKNGAKCMARNGYCRCAPGYHGLTCSALCPVGWYGADCASKCKCKNNALCHPTDGKCTCLPGFMGAMCDQKCPPWQFGFGCRQDCSCDIMNAMSCDHQTGICMCKPGYSGVDCRSTCPEGKWGDSCTQTCFCKNNGTCDSKSGGCLCRSGFQGGDCGSKCPAGYYGEGCQTQCKQCGQGLVCDHVTGRCYAKECPAGFQGPECRQVCEKGYYGKSCNTSCPSCKHGSLCDYVRGNCICMPGWTGDLCEKPCRAGYYGYKCKSRCNCENGGECRRTDGSCHCFPGYMGFTCSQSCSEGYYGQDCHKLCNCDEKETCHPVHGCISSATVNTRVAPMEESSVNGTVVAMSVVAVVLVIVVVLLVFYFRNRVKRLQENKSDTLQFYSARNQGNGMAGIINPVYGANTGTNTNIDNLNNRRREHDNQMQPPGPGPCSAAASCSSSYPDDDEGRYTDFKALEAHTYKNASLGASNTYENDPKARAKDMMYKNKIQVDLVNNLDKSEEPGPPRDYDNVSLDSIDMEKARNKNWPLYWAPQSLYRVHLEIPFYFTLASKDTPVIICEGSIYKVSQKVMTTTTTLSLDWKAGKTLSECLEHLLTSGIASDVTFLVGKDRKRISAHKLVLISRSPVFYAMFEGLMAEKGEITIPDVSEDTFKLFLRYLYTDTLDFTEKNTVPVLSVARKYCVDILVTRCEEYLHSTLSVDNACLFLELAHEFVVENLKTECIHLIFDFPEAILQSKSFTDLSPSNVASITESDDLQADECDVYNAVIMWAEAECKRQNIETTPDNKREVLGDILYTVRFPVMDEDFFLKKVGHHKILSAENILETLNFQNHQEKVPGSKLKHDERKLSLTPHKLWRVEGTLCSNWVAGLESVSFTVSDSLRLLGFGSFYSHGDNTVNVVIYEDRRVAYFADNISRVKSDSEHIGKVLLTGRDRIRLKPNNVYTITERTAHKRKYYFDERIIQESFKYKRTTITFCRPVVTLPDANGHNRNQIPYLLLS